MSGEAPPPADATAAVEALRRRGAHRVDPVRFARIEALARRAGAHDGEARRTIEARLAQLLAAYGPCPPSPPPAGATAAAPMRPPAADTLGGLLARLARHGSGPDAPADGLGAAAPAAAELKTVREHRRAWSRLGVEQRIAQTRASVPENAGPLNTQRLLHQALTTLHVTAPDYLQRLVTQVEALLWLDQARLGDGPPKAAAARPARGRSPGAARR